MDTTKDEGRLSGVTSTEMLAMVGFALFFGWMFICFYWLFCEFPPDVDVAERDFAQLFVFVGVAAGMLILHFAAKNPTFNLFDGKAKAIQVCTAVLLPLAALAMYLGIRLPLPIVWAVNFLAGIAAAGIRVCWMDVCSRVRDDSYGLFSGASLFAGGLLFVLVAFLPQIAQPIFAIVYVVLSEALVVFVSPRIEGNDTRAPLDSTTDTWKFSGEIEPSFMMFGVVFGLTFVFLFNNGAEAVLLGLISSLVGSFAVCMLSITQRQLGITTYQRLLVVVTVFACVMLPLMRDAYFGQLALSCVVTAAWSLFVGINMAYLARKCALDNEAPLFRQAPRRLFFSTCGFAIGWLLATVVSLAFGPHSLVFGYLRPVVAIVLVAVVMVFLPVSDHHAPDGKGFEPSTAKAAQTIITVNRTEQELFEARCQAVSKLYQLSPRETEVLGFLAKGRNAAYIQEALIVSPHTVKSHIYNVYRKLDIHSQQKLMDFIEDYPLEG